MWWQRGPVFADADSALCCSRTSGQTKCKSSHRSVVLGGTPEQWALGSRRRSPGHRGVIRVEPVRREARREMPVKRVDTEAATRVLSAGSRIRAYSRSCIPDRLESKDSAVDGDHWWIQTGSNRWS